LIPIGAQVPMAGGLSAALEYAVAAGCETMQIFAKSPRRWSAAPLDERAVAEFHRACSDAGMGPVFTHASYLINMGAEEPELWDRSATALADELVRGSQIGAAGVVVHLGRRFSDDDAACCERVADCAGSAVAMAARPCPPLLLENSAGAGRQFGASIEEMGAALNAVIGAGVAAGVCLDTCHAFAAGMDVGCAEAWAKATERLERLCVAGAIWLVHANDCKGELGSHRDRHDWIGEGRIGWEGFIALFEQPWLSGAAVIVEMPGDGPEKDAENVTRLKRLRDGDGASAGRARGRA
jgi:deoxyribonuclease-4